MNKHGIIGLVAIVSMFTMMFGFSMGVRFADSLWRENAIKRGFAEYHQTTGKWQWKGSK